MGHFRLKRIGVITVLSELAGYKAGLALSRQDIVALLPNVGDLFTGADNDTLRFGADEFEELTTQLLYRLGTIPRPERELPEFVLWRKYKGNQKKILLVDDISQQFTNFAEKALQSTDGPIDLSLFLREVIQRYHTPSAFKMALEYVDALVVYLNSGFDQIFRSVAWADRVSLADLFRSESLDTFYGAFFDQRYIDYLYSNFDEIDRINWRKFEGFTAEFFKRSGFAVEIGPGRNDDSVDVRVWPREDEKHLPPTLLVQCKRQKEKVEKVVVKALYADILDAKARSGLIVTTSMLSPGAETVCTARAYPIGQANRDTLRQWIMAMRSPYSGVFLGE